MIVILFLFSVISYCLWQKQELKKFEISEYQVTNEKVNHSFRIVVISDLHSFSYGKRNERLFQAIQSQDPDLILVPGDLIVSAQVEKYEIAEVLMRRLTALAPVVLSNGNHESRVEMPESEFYHSYRQYQKKLERNGVRILNNRTMVLQIKGNAVSVSGLEIPLSSYRKGRKPYLKPDFIDLALGRADAGHLQILLAHNPSFAEQYAAWGADLTFCGHNHGGLVRIPGIGSLISPQLELFPKYDAGEYTVLGRKVFVSRGLGTHTFHIRIFNRAQLMSVLVQPGKPQK